MEKNTKIVIAIGVAGLAYFLYKKGYFAKANVAEVTPIDVTPIEVKPLAPVYPSGYVENDYVRNPSGDGTVYMLHKGQKLPITYAWMLANAKNDWGLVKDMSAGLLLDIPTGNVLDA
jgi:hypothetical protein